MKITHGLVLLILLSLSSASGQPISRDSLQTQLLNTNNDTTRIKLLNSIADYYNGIRQDSSIYYATRAIELSEKINYPEGSFKGYARISFLLNTSSNYSKALEMALQSLKIAERLKTNRELSMAESYHMMGLFNRRIGNDTISLRQSLQSIQLYKDAGAKKGTMSMGPFMNAALVYLKWKMLDSALAYAKMCYEVSVANQEYQEFTSVSPAATTLAQVYEETGDIPLAQVYYLIGLNVCNKYPNAKLFISRFYNNYARFLRKTGNFDSSIYYARLSLQLGRDNSFGEHTSDAAAMLTQAYELQKNPDSALKYMKVFLALKDSIFNRTKLEQIQLLNFEEDRRQRDMDLMKERYQNQVKLYTLIAAAGIFLVVSLILYRNNRQKQRANNLLRVQKREIDNQCTKAEDALQELSSAQAQLIQSEKMASLGELTAGIAHEIQNPLNFVNNFSEINSELLSELGQNLDNGNRTTLKAIVANLKENEAKIASHGKRADSIVKGMLQHSKKGSGQKEPTDINALCDEYLRLSYHACLSGSQGMRAQDKSRSGQQVGFTATIQTDFDKSIDYIPVVPQDIGRVLLNLFNNAFYAVMEKTKSVIGEYQPIVRVSSKKINDTIEIRVTDNGSGIPEQIREKIFQPFFTTKPSGQGTGLGLSLSYDIIKAHGGKIRMETKEDEGTAFIIELQAT